MLSERIINRTIRPLTSEERKDAFIFDDTVFSRTGGKKTELCSHVFGECKMNTIAMVKKTSKVFYSFDGKRMNIKQIFAARARSGPDAPGISCPWT